MQRPLLLLALIGVAIIGGVSLAGYYLGQLAENRAAASPSPVAIAEASPSPEEPSPSPSPSPEAASPSPSPVAARRRLLPTAPPSRPLPVVKGLSAYPSFPAVLPLIGQESETSFDESFDTGGDDGTVDVSFVNLPSEVNAGESFTVSWRVSGPSGKRGSTTLKTSLSSSSGGSNASSTSNQTFGSIVVPKTLSTRLSFGGSGETIHLEITANVDGATASTSANIRLNH